MSHETIEITISRATVAMLKPGEALDLGLVPAGAVYCGCTEIADGDVVLRFERPGPIELIVGIATKDKP